MTWPLTTTNFDPEAEAIAEDVFNRIPYAVTLATPLRANPDEERRFSNERPTSDFAVTTSSRHSFARSPELPRARDPLPLSPEEKRAFYATLDRDDKIAGQIMAAAAAHRGQAIPNLSGEVPCLLHPDGVARIDRTKDGCLVYVCACDPATGTLTLGPIDLYASCISGQATKLSRQSLVRWRVRALAEIGHLTLPDTSDLVDPPSGVPASAQQVYAGWRLLVACEREIGDVFDQPLVFTCTFAAAWKRVPRSSAHEAMKLLTAPGGPIVPVGWTPAPGKTYRLYRPRTRLDARH